MQHHSFGLAALNQEIIQPGYRILDLGPIAVGTTQAFLQKNCPCYIEDLLEFFADNHNATDLKAALKSHLVAKPEKIKFDVILCWDLLNFLSAELIAYLIELLSPNLKPGTLLHAMIYTGAQPPQRPARFKLLRDFTYETADDPNYPRIPYQGHTTVTLMQSLGRFNLSNSLVQRQGMRKDLIEYFFEFDTTAPAGRVRPGTESDLSTYFSGTNIGAALTMSGLDSAMQAARKSPVSRVMDCGARSGRNIGALQQQVGELFVLDLHAAIQWRKKRGEDGCQAIRAAFEKFAGLEPCDVILSWDLLIYYSAEETQVLSGLLRGKLKPGGLLHIVFYKRARLAQRPSVFEVQADGGILVKEFPLSDDMVHFTNMAQIIRVLPSLQLSGQGHGKLPGGAFYHELTLKKLSEV
ncbi:class I SAM-dependent methyltransferase [Microbulbifer sp. SAOS-129_SWC]|uniref:class I SAM-dependent methyltransferase n=1 Tax=Microbulbifer sp. SAOS-129_SWC TaxID=3145235 RepID=UPI003216FC09